MEGMRHLGERFAAAAPHANPLPHSIYVPVMGMTPDKGSFSGTNYQADKSPCEIYISTFLHGEKLVEKVSQVKRLRQLISC